MTAMLIDGNKVAADLRGGVTKAADRLVALRGVSPGLAVVVVGENPASEVYVANKKRMVAQTGMRSCDHRMCGDAQEDDLLALIGRLNADPAIHGILIQLPLPPQIHPAKVIEAVDPQKDVDGFHPTNIGRLAVGLPAFAPCTPLGCVRLAQLVHPSLAGLDAVIIGRSNIVGKPLSHLLTAADATVTVAHSRTRDIAARCRHADLLVSATGRPGLVRGDWIKPGATVIDVGINRVVDSEGRSRIVGDIAFDEAVEVAGAITPVPGGVGPMTIACLLANTVTAAYRLEGLPPPQL